MSFAGHSFTYNGFNWFECKFATAGERRVASRSLRCQGFVYERRGLNLWVQLEDFHRWF